MNTELDNLQPDQHSVESSLDLNHQEMVNFYDQQYQQSSEYLYNNQEYQKKVKRSLIINQIFLSIILIYYIIQFTLEIRVLLKLNSSGLQTFQLSYITIKLILDTLLILSLIRQSLNHYQLMQFPQILQLIKFQYKELGPVENFDSNQEYISSIIKSVCFDQTRRYFFNLQGSLYQAIIFQLILIQVGNFIAFLGIVTILGIHNYYQIINIIQNQQAFFQMVIVIEFPQVLTVASVAGSSVFATLIVLLSFLMSPFYVLITCIMNWRSQQKKQRQSQLFQEQLRHKIFDEIDLKDQKAQQCCAICLSDFMNKDEVTIIPCQVSLEKQNMNHFFHKVCIKQWFDVQYSCPTCRKKFIQ